MAERNTAITGKQIKAAVAGDGLLKDANQNIGVDVSDFAGTGLEDDGTENLRISAAAAGNGLTGGAGSALAVGAGDGIDVAADSVSVDVTDFIDTASGLTETTNDIQVNIDTTFLEFSTGAISLKDDSITEVKLDIFNAPVNGYYLQYDTTNGMQWSDVAGGFVEKTDVISNEIPTGLVNSSNTDYTVANSIASGTLQVLLNGVQQEPGSGNDYTLSGTTVTFAEAPDTGDIVMVNYLIA